MNIAETAALCKALKVIDPTMAVSDEALAAWHAIIGRYPYGQCVAAVERISHTRRRDGRHDASAIDPYDVAVAVRAIRTDCLDRIAVPCPNVDPADAVAWAAELQALKVAIMDGRISPADAVRYAGGGFRITAGEPFRAIESGEMVHFDPKALVGPILRSDGGP